MNATLTPLRSQAIPVTDPEAGLRMTEIFYSLQGEALTAGLPTIFVRLTGCPLRCVYCDTTYSFTGGERLSLDTILANIAQYPCKRVCITGGEPLAQPRPVSGAVPQPRAERASERAQRVCASSGRAERAQRVCHRVQSQRASSGKILICSVRPRCGGWRRPMGWLAAVASTSWLIWCTAGSGSCVG